MTWDVPLRFCGMLVLAGAIMVAGASITSGLTLQAQARAEPDRADPRRYDTWLKGSYSTEAFWIGSFLLIVAALWLAALAKVVYDESKSLDAPGRPPVTPPEKGPRGPGGSVESDRPD